MAPLLPVPIVASPTKGASNGDADPRRIPLVLDAEPRADLVRGVAFANDAAPPSDAPRLILVSAASVNAEDGVNATNITTGVASSNEGARLGNFSIT